MSSLIEGGDLSMHSRKNIGEARRVRILIDCALVSANTTITGIPRVVFKYLEYGYRYGRMHGVEVLPVYVGPEGVIEARYNLPSWTYDAPAFAVQDAPDQDTIPLSQLQKIRALQRWHRYLRIVAAPVARTLAVRLRFFGFDKLVERARTAYHRRMHRRALAIGAAQEVAIDRGDILFMPAYWHDEFPDSYRKVQENGALIVPLLHDVLPITLPESYNPGWRDMFRRNVIEVARLCDHLMYVSASTRNDFVRVLSSAGVVEPPHSIHHHGSDFSLPDTHPKSSGNRVSQSIRTFFREPDFHLLMVGTLEPKKNHLLVLSECQALWARGLKFKLTIVGRAGWKSEVIDARISAALKHPTWGSNVAWFRNASDEDLEFAYANSQLCVLASDGEGFGIPLIEALARKVPVLASDIPAFRETGGDHVAFFDQRAHMRLSNVLAHLIEDPQFYEDLRRRANSFDWPDWGSLCDKTFDQLRTITPRRSTSG